MLASFLLLNELLYLACHACTSILSETIDHTGHFENVMDGGQTLIIQPPSSQNNTSRTNADSYEILPAIRTSFSVFEQTKIKYQSGRRKLH